MLQWIRNEDFSLLPLNGRAKLSAARSFLVSVSAFMCAEVTSSAGRLVGDHMSWNLSDLGSSTQCEHRRDRHNKTVRTNVRIPPWPKLALNQHHSSHRKTCPILSIAASLHSYSLRFSSRSSIHGSTLGSIFFKCFRTCTSGVLGGVKVAKDQVFRNFPLAGISRSTVCTL